MAEGAYVSFAFFMKTVLTIFIFFGIKQLYAQPLPQDWFLLINDKYTIQGTDTVPEYDTVCLGQNFEFEYHIGQTVRSLDSMLTIFNNTDTLSELKGTYQYTTSGWHEIYIRHWLTLIDGTKLSNGQGSFFIYVAYCPPQAQFIPSATTICQNTCLNVTDNSTNYPQSYEWRFEGGTPQLWGDKTPPPVCYADTGTHKITLIVSNPAGADTSIRNVRVNPGPQPVAVEHTFQITEGDFVTLAACATGDIYSWSNPIAIITNNDTTVIVQPEETQTYPLIISAFGCISNCDYTVYVKSGLLLPTGFSPNGDGVNDVFHILNTNITLNYFAVYNRWGVKLFETKKIDEGWDGIYEDMLQPIETYTWQADYTITKTGKHKGARGNVTLVR